MAELFPQKPTAPHLSVYRMTWLMLSSIMHRITGAAMYFGMLLVAWFLLSLALGPDSYRYFFDFSRHIVGRLILFGYSWVILHHLLGGIRYLIWDTGHALEIHAARRMAIANWIGSFFLVLMLWALAGEFSL